jgi:hypothetical protein
MFRQLFSGDFKPYKGNYGIAVSFPEQKTFFQRYFLADTLLSALTVSRLFPEPDQKRKLDEEVILDRDKAAESVRDFAMDLYFVLARLLAQYLHDQQQAEVAQRQSETEIRKECEEQP